MHIVAGVDLGGTAVNYTLVNGEEQFLIEGLCEHPALSKQGPDICLQQIEDGLAIAAGKAGIALSDIAAVGLDTPGPASASGVLSAKGSTNFVHPDWAGYDIRLNLEKRLGKPVTYLNDGNAGALWGHFTLFGGESRETSLSAIIGTGLGGGVIVEGNVVKGRKGFGGELGHVLIPVSKHHRHPGPRPRVQLRAYRMPGIGLFPDRHRAFVPAVFPGALSRPQPGQIGRHAQGRQDGPRAGGEGRPDVCGHFSRAGPGTRTLLR